jgi:hypothetical protein
MADKILVTGMNKAQTHKDFWLRQELKVVPSHYSLVRCLEDMGYEVEHRFAEIGEDLSKFKHVIAYVHTPKSYAQRLFEGLYAVGARDDVILAIDDWQADQIFNSVREFKKWFEPDVNPSSIEYIFALQDVRSFYESAIDKITSKTRPLLISAFDHGDLNLLNMDWKGPLHSYNPNPYHFNRTPQNNFGRGVMTFGFGEVVKERKWNFASLVQNKTRKWISSLKLEWEVDYFGSRRGEHKSTRLTEDQMCEVFQSQWGCLMPSYYHAGSGWWRARPLQLADVGSVLVTASDKEAAVYGEAYVGVKPSDVEGMSYESLTALAKRQRDCLYEKHPLDRAHQRAQLEKVLS